MDALTFDHLARTLVTRGSRRTALGALMATGAALGLAGTHRATAQTGCSLKANGQRCQRHSECCSGRCKRRRRDRHGTCRQADQQGICTIEHHACAASPTRLVCGTGAGTPSGECACLVTSKGRSFCGGGVAGVCDCTSHRQCEREFGKGAKCVATSDVCTGSGCATTCASPCPQPTTPTEAA